MKNKGVGAFAVIVIAIVIATVAAGVYVLMSGGGGTGLPVYPESSKVNIPTTYKAFISFAGVNAEAYDADGSLKEVAAWYENKMSAKGWSKMGEYVQENPGMVYVGWKKGSKGAGISVYTKEAQADENYADLFEDNILHLYSGDWEKIQDFLSLPSTPSETEGLVSSFAPPGSAPDGLAWDGEHLWNADDNTEMIYELDTEGTIVSSFESPRTDSGGLAWDGAYLWLVYPGGFGENGKLYKIGPDTENVVKSTKIPIEEPTGLAWDGNHFWVSNDEIGNYKMYELDASGALISSFGLPSGTTYPSGLAWDGNYLWLADHMKAKIFKIDTDGNVTSAFDSPGEWPTGLAWDGEHLWNADSKENIYEIDTSTYK